ncbi:hypothetical protein DM806_12885 [Sphingobium lactosutens]|uniref:hypothetical protein n=1 Tax=Sphingobium lactosutens TaxID=522773 RepID=UPI0015BFBBFA|nr:hypothetical protein [Sphingobium lactosutens]NWK96539.1 hypothetical protein [Sphingobium lactosutens]
MSREVLHPIHCPCSCCRHPAEEAISPDQAAIIHGLAAGVLFGGAVAAIRYIPALVDWLMAA